MKLYSIVRVDGNHKPSYFEVERIENIADLKLLDNVVKTYGDTKEQMIKKVVQILFKNAPKETYQPRYIEQKRKILKVAEEIVEFLGVK